MKYSRLLRHSGCGWLSLPKNQYQLINKTKLYKCIDIQNSYVEYYKEKYPDIDYDKVYADYHNKPNDKFIKSGVFGKFQIDK